MVKDNCVLVRPDALRASIVFRRRRLSEKKIGINLTILSSRLCQGKYGVCESRKIRIRSGPGNNLVLTCA